jgi:hypothetical protein
MARYRSISARTEIDSNDFSSRLSLVSQPGGLFTDD